MSKLELVGGPAKLNHTYHCLSLSCTFVPGVVHDSGTTAFSIQIWTSWIGLSIAYFCLSTCELIRAANAILSGIASVSASHVVFEGNTARGTT
jgi:hypothetical protein